MTGQDTTHWCAIWSSHRVLVCDAVHTAAQYYQNISDCLKSGGNKTLRNRTIRPTGCTIYFQFISILTSTCFQQAYCSSSGGTTLLIQPTASQHKRMTYTNW